MKQGIKTIRKLRVEFKTWESVVITDKSNEDTGAETSSSSAPAFMRKVFSNDQTQINHETEIDNYLNKNVTATQPEATGVYQW